MVNVHAMSIYCDAGLFTAVDEPVRVRVDAELTNVRKVAGADLVDQVKASIQVCSLLRQRGNPEYLWDHFFTVHRARQAHTQQARRQVCDTHTHAHASRFSNSRVRLSC